MFIASFDIGYKNFSFYIEEIDENKLYSIILPKKIDRYDKNNNITISFQNSLNQIYQTGKTILFKNQNISSSSSSTLDLCINMYDYLDLFQVYWNKVDIFIIEQQMSFGKKYNTIALKLAQNCQSYFIFKYGRFKKIIEIPAYYKTQILGCPKKETGKYYRKKWTVSETRYIFFLRNEYDLWKEFESYKKLDDISDNMTQLQAFKILLLDGKFKL